MLKPCARCGRTDADFSIRGSGERASYCKSCQREYSRQHYLSHKADHNGRRYRNHKTTRARIRALIDEKKTVPCHDCGEAHPAWAMDFDHRDPAQKSFTIGEKAFRVTREDLLSEIEKCDVVCALCHRYRTYGMRRHVA